LIKLIALFGIDLAIVQWIKTLTREQFTWTGFVQGICLIVLATMIYADILKTIQERMRK
jgi:hypothetical protein